LAENCQRQDRLTGGVRDVHVAAVVIARAGPELADHLPERVQRRAPRRRIVGEVTPSPSRGLCEMLKKYRGMCPPYGKRAQRAFALAAGALRPVSRGALCSRYAACAMTSTAMSVTAAVIALNPNPMKRRPL
jgi:hypothetical protein